MRKVYEIEPEADQAVLVSFRDLFKAMNIKKTSFDKAILKMAKDQKIWLHRHHFPSTAISAEVVKRGDDVFMGMVLRK
jgi:hypothetical protein